MKMRLPTDRQILEKVYRRYYPVFARFSREGDARDTKVYVPIDIASIAAELGVDGDIIFGRLYYHLDSKYGYKKSDGTLVPFFYLQVGADRHCVNFPLLASVLASLRTEHLRFRLATALSIVSLAISAAALAVSLATNLLRQPADKKTDVPQGITQGLTEAERPLPASSGQAASGVHPGR